MSFLEDLVESDTPVEDYAYKMLDYMSELEPEVEGLIKKCQEIENNIYSAVREGKTYADCRNKMLDYVLLENRTERLIDDRNFIYEVIYTDTKEIKQKVRDHICQIKKSLFDPDTDKSKINRSAVSRFYYIQDDARLVDSILAYRARQEAEKEAEKNEQ